MTTIGLRKIWFQVHKWIGLILAVLIIPISLSGSILVWHEPIERALHPERFATTGTATLAPTAFADAAQAALHKGEWLTRIEIAKAGPVKASVSRMGGGRMQRITLYLDPPTARVLGVERSGEGPMQWVHTLHGSLTVPGTGRTIVGWVGVAMLLSTLTGLWLWWPLGGSVTRGFRWKRHRNTDTNLHHLVGFWVSVPLFVLSLTGVWISFPSVFAGFDGAPRQAAGPGQPRAVPLATPHTPLQTAVEHAESAGLGRVRSVTWPTDLKPSWSIEGFKSPVPVEIADATGQDTIRSEPLGAPPRQTLARTMRGIHDGSSMPFVWQLIIFLGGLIPAILAVTGIIMWWRARGWRGEVTTRMKSASA